MKVQLEVTVEELRAIVDALEVTVPESPEYLAVALRNSLNEYEGV